MEAEYYSDEKQCYERMKYRESFRIKESTREDV